MARDNGWDKLGEAYESSSRSEEAMPNDVLEEDIGSKLDVIIEKLDEIRFMLWDKETMR